MAALINCRCKESADCYHGQPEEGVYGQYPTGAREDRTYDEEDGSVVCDACYIAVGQPTFQSIPELNARLARVGKLRRG